jgi:cell division protein FtsL
MDNALYVMHLTAVLCLGTSAVACPVLLYSLLLEIRELRTQITKSCECRHDGPGPVLPRVLPRVRRIGEEAD